ncbi:MAG: TerB family tellurite resistance protein [Gammaproteobacteria bacterium]|nr:TerB family tellurite resistance protein [Gammaproteobacteria bacterium]
MLAKLHKLLAETLGSDADTDVVDDAAEIRLAAAALLIEISRADDSEDPKERELAARLVRERFELGDAETEQLMQLASARADESISLFEFTNRLKDALDENGRGDVIEMLWDVVYADGQVDPYEEHLLRRIADLLYVTHSEFIRRKHLAAERHGVPY